MINKLIFITLFLIISIFIEKSNTSSLYYVSKNNKGCNFKYENGYSGLWCQDDKIYQYFTEDNWSSIAEFKNVIGDQLIVFYNKEKGNYDILSTKTGEIKHSDFIEEGCKSITIPDEYSQILLCTLPQVGAEDLLLKYSINAHNGTLTLIK